MNKLGWQVGASVAMICLFCGRLAGRVYAVNEPDIVSYFSPGTWVTPGMPLSYTVEVTNTDESAVLTGIEVVTTVDTHSQYGYSLVSAEAGFECLENVPSRNSPKTSTCTGGLLGAGETATIVYSVVTPPTVSSRSFYYDGISSMNTYGVSSNDRVLVAWYYAPNYIVTGTVSPATAMVGRELLYTVAVRNNGYLSAPATTASVVLPNGQMLTEYVPPLGVDAVVNYSYSYFPQSSGTFFANIAVDSADTVEEGLEMDNSLTLQAVVIDQLPDLVVEQTQPASVAVGMLYNKVVRVRNTGNSVATGIRLIDTFFVSDTLSLSGDYGFGCTRTTYRVNRSSVRRPNGFECTGGVLQPGETATITAVVRAPWYQMTVSNTVTVDPRRVIDEGSESNNTVSGRVTIH